MSSRIDLITAILSAAPTADISDPSWGHILAKDFSIEVNLGTDEPVGSVMLHVRGGDGAIALIAEILDRLNARALDIQTGEVLEETAAATSLAAWRSYRDYVISQPGQASSDRHERCQRYVMPPPERADRRVDPTALNSPP